MANPLRKQQAEPGQVTLRAARAASSSRSIYTDDTIASSAGRICAQSGVVRLDAGAAAEFKGAASPPTAPKSAPKGSKAMHYILLGLANTRTDYR
jgi:hypothetical protein